MGSLSLILTSLAACAVLCTARLTPELFCMFDCSTPPLTRTQCSETCQPPEGCTLVPMLPPLFLSMAECQAFAALKPTCQPGGSCYAGQEPPQLPSEWSQGYMMNLTEEVRQWEYSVLSVERGETMAAVDPVGQNMISFSKSTQVQGLAPGRSSSSGMLLLGKQGKLFMFINESIFGESQCMYQTLPYNVTQWELASARFANYTFAEDSTYMGEDVQVFHDATAELGVSMSGVVPGRLAGEPAGNSSITVSAQRLGPARLYVSRTTRAPVHVQGSFVVPSAYWNGQAGFQGSALSGNVTSFLAGRPPASIFKVPKAWGVCKPQPKPPGQLGVAQLMARRTLANTLHAAGQKAYAEAAQSLLV